MAKTTIIRGLDEKIWKRFRRVCLERGISANSLVKFLIEEFVEKHG